MMMIKRKQKLGLNGVSPHRLKIQFYHSCRSYLGGVAMGLGGIGLLLFAAALPFSMFMAHFWGGFGFREGQQPTPGELDAAVTAEFDWMLWHRLVPLLIFSVCLIGYGFYETWKEKQRRE